MGKGFSELGSVQRPLSKYAVSIGWTPLSQEEALALRGGEGGLFLREVLKAQLLALNADFMTDDLAEAVIKKLENVRTTIDGNEEVLRWLRGERSVYVPAEKRERDVVLADFDDPDANEFHVTEEWSYTNGVETNRADVVFAVNGIPAVLLEAKAPHIPDAIDEAIGQVRRYHRETPELVTHPQLFDVTHLIDFYYGATWSLARRNLFNWKDEVQGDFERKVKAFFDRPRLLTVFRDYITFVRRDDQLEKMVLRQHQTRANERGLERVRDPAKRRGLIWHTQGSGKTLTMLTMATQLLTRDEFDKPLVVMIVDRNELESQLFTNLTAHGIENVEVAASKRHLQRLLKEGYRGLVLTMLHKFDGIQKDSNTSEDVVVLVDEAHRSTGGDFGNYLMGALPNATFIGFTGTPIDKTAHGGGTFKVFGTDDPEGYLDKYSIRESIEDGTTLPLSYALAPNDLLVPTEQLEKEFLALTEEEGVADIEELNRVLDKAVKLKTFLKSKDRVETVAAFIAKHFRENVEPLGYKAFVVGVDREACALYKDALDKHLGESETAVVYTGAHNDPERIKRFQLSEEQEKQLRKDFLAPDKEPKILIVTEKLLTGFDAPILYCMYLDKPMRDHTLLQAIARVNRPYETEGEVRKPVGFVVDFVGIFEKLERALAFDSDVVEGVIQNLDVLKTRFAELISKADTYLDLVPKTHDDKAVEEVIEAFRDREFRQTFQTYFKELERLYEVISPDAFLRDHVGTYLALARLHQLVVAYYGRRTMLVKDLMRKTEELVRRDVKGGGVGGVLPVQEINEETLKLIQKDKKGGAGKVINLAKSLSADVRKKEAEQPYLVPIAARADAVLEQFDDRQLSTTKALEELEKQVKNLLEAEELRKKLDLDVGTFSTYWVIRQAGVEKPEEVAPQLQKAFLESPDFAANQEERRSLRLGLYKVLLPVVGEEEKTTEIVNELIEVQKSAKSS